MRKGRAHEPSPCLGEKLLTVDGYWVFIKGVASGKSTVLQWMTPHLCLYGQ